MNIKDLLKEYKTVEFIMYRKGELWYKLNDTFSFPVPIDDCGDAEFLASDRSIFFMRWVNKQLKNIAEGKAECQI